MKLRVRMLLTDPQVKEERRPVWEAAGADPLRGNRHDGDFLRFSGVRSELELQNGMWRECGGRSRPKGLPFSIAFPPWWWLESAGLLRQREGSVH